MCGLPGKPAQIPRFEPLRQKSPLEFHTLTCAASPLVLLICAGFLGSQHISASEI